MAKIAVNAKRDPAQDVTGPGGIQAHCLAKGDGWSVEDVVCSRGPHDRRFEEQHNRFVIAIVTSGTFQYRRSGSGEELMTPGSLLLGRPGQCFECGHEHGVGDRCLAFHFSADYFARLANRDPRQTLGAFQSPRVSPVRVLSPVIADACAALSGSPDPAWEELGIRLAARALRMDADRTSTTAAEPAAIARVTESVRSITDDPGSSFTLVQLAREAGLSPFHFLRMFERVTGTTPHQYMLRTRLRKAAIRLVTETTKIVDVAFESGFGDISNFNRAFRAEFGATPTSYRRRRGS